MKHSTDRILTTHCGSLARPKGLLDLMKAKLNNEPYDRESYDRRVQGAVSDIVRKQVENGIDVVTDGEQSKPGFFAYVRERLSGFEAKTPPPGGWQQWAAEVAMFPEYYENYFSRRMMGGSIVPRTPMVCTAPISYRGQDALRKDIENLKAALVGLKAEEAFMPAVAPSGVGTNEYYRSNEEYLQAVGDALRTEYQEIVGAGFILQIDDPWLTEVHSQDPSLTSAQRRKIAEQSIEALNHAIRDIPPEKIRFHTCYGINEGPRVHDAPLKDIVDLILKVNAGAYAFEAANPRHEHEYRVWETVKLPAGKILIPGVITHCSNIVEHPELIAERLSRYAKVVGRENVIAGSDCGFSSQATYSPEVHPSVVWAKFQAMAEGARLATKQLWR
ncbi:MAG TPA: cobalamin-independent methionine synthase II family protein [Candidatus Binatia bacterium]|nr:cobalamin-independent methionine synthase II family protein [Candidatus Binatia bacterium]